MCRRIQKINKPKELEQLRKDTVAPRRKHTGNYVVTESYDDRYKRYSRKIFPIY